MTLSYLTLNEAAELISKELQEEFTYKHVLALGKRETLPVPVYAPAKKDLLFEPYDWIESIGINPRSVSYVSEFSILILSESNINELLIAGETRINELLRLFTTHTQFDRIEYPRAIGCISMGCHPPIVALDECRVHSGHVQRYVRRQLCYRKLLK